MPKHTIIFLLYKVKVTVTYRNPTTSVVIRKDLCGNYRNSLGSCGDRLSWARNCLWESAELSFGCPWNCLTGVLRTIFGSPQIIEPANHSSGVVRTIAVWFYERLWKPDFFTANGEFLVAIQAGFQRGGHLSTSPFSFVSGSKISDTYSYLR